MRELAERQHGAVARRQLLELGLGSRLIDHWREVERVKTVYRGVYALSEVLLSQRGRWMAAVLAVGSDAVLSHDSAAALWGIRRDRPGPIHVTVTRRLSRRPGLILHRFSLAPDEHTARDGIPVTSVGRTLFDIAHSVTPHELEQAVREADYRRLSGGPSLSELVGRYPRRTGVRAVRRLLDAGWSEAPSRSELESRFAAFVDEHDLGKPERNALIELENRRVEVDFLWRRQQVAVELDGYAAHRMRDAFEDDRERDRLLQRAGFKVVRVTWRQLHRDRSALARDLRAMCVA